MKRKTLLFLMLMALGVPLAMNGQTRTDLTVADQTGTSTYVPFYGLYVDDYQHNQTIYPSTMLTQMQGGQITKLTYYLSSSVTKVFGATIEIRLGTTTSTAFSTGTVNYISISGNPVYTNTNLSVSGTTVEFDFSNNPYTYTSGNLVVDVRITSPGGWTSTTWLGESASTVYSAYGYSSSMPTQGNGLTFMPKTTFTYTVSSTPQIVLSPGSATVITGSTQTLTATTLNVTGTPSISYSTSNASVATVSGSGTSATVTGVAPGNATITATMTYQGNTYTATSAITVEDPSYCTPSFGSNTDCITNITLGSINNTTASSSTNGYGDYTSMSTSLEQGETTTLSLTSGAGSGTHAAAVWIDFDDSYSFESSERVGTQDGISGSSTVSISLTIPNNAAVGSHRMRVVYQYSVSATNIDPCASATYGEGEDYTVTITAASNCPAPTNLTATNLTPTSATLNWEGEAESYNVRYAEITGTVETQTFFDDFENGLSNWTTYTMGNADAWSTTDPSEGLDWSGHNGSTNVAISMSWNGDSYTADNWLVTPQVQLGGTLKFYVYTNQGYPDDYEVKLSTGGNSISDFTVTLQEMASIPTTGDWVEVNIDLSSYEGQSGYIAIHHSFYDGNYILVDDFGIYAVEYQLGPWTNRSTDDNFLDITGLTSETEYEWQVMADCGNDGQSAWVSGNNFTTPDACTVPTGLTAEVTGIAANLSWTGVQENYNVKYGKVVYFEDFEGGSIPTGWTTINNDGDSYDWYYDNQNSIGHSGTGVMSSASSVNPGSGWVDFEPDNWLVSPQLDLQGTLSVWVRSQNAQEEFYQEHFAIYISTTGTNASDFSVIVPESVTTTEYVEYTADLSSYEGQQGYIAIRHFNCNGQFRMNIDDFGIYDDIHTVTATTVPFTINNLKPSSNYMWQVQGVDCDGNGGTTDWSASASFTTGIAPYEITASADPTEGGTVAFMTGAASTSAHTHLPLDSYRDYSFSQQIYTPEEVGGGTINSISLFSVYGNLNDDGINYTRNLDVYLVHTSKTEFSSSSDWISVTNADKVFSGNVEFICGEWNTINFTTPFNYNGTSNLALIIADNTSESAAVGNYLECRTFEPSSGVYCSLNDDTQFNPSSPSGDGERLTQKNQILVNGSATRTFPEGATCTLVATPNTDYRFVDWTENDEQASTDATYSFTVTGDRNLVANFEPNSHTVTIVPNNTDYGSVSQGTVVNVHHGATISTSGNTLTVDGTTVTANPAQATGQYTYAFSDWSNVPATVTEDVTITAIFTQTVNSYTVTIEPNDANYGSVSQGSVTSVPYGTTITTSDNTLTVGSTTVTATPQASTAQYTYAFSSWSNVTETVTGNVTITANFTQTTNSYALTLIADPTAGGTVSGGGTYNYGEEVTITATAKPGYTFGSWSDNGAQSHTVTITGDATYTATFTQNEYTLTLTADPTEGGMLSASPTGPYHYNDEVEVTATPNSGFNFGAWSDGGAQTHNVTITDDTELIAYFGADHTLTTYVNPIEGGYVTIAENQVSTIGAVTVGSGTGHNNQSPFASNTQYSFVESLYLKSEMPGSCTITSLSFESTDGMAQSNEIEVYMMNVDKTSFTGRTDFVAMTTDVKVFDGTWTVSSAGWNTIILDTPFEYDSEKNLLIGIHEKSSGTVGSISFRMTENTTGSVLCWDNDNNDDMNPADLNDLKASNHTQEKLNYRANVRLGFGTYHNGQSVTLTAHANEGYQFVNWTENDIELGTNDTYTVSMTDDLDHTIYANFERIIKRFVTDGDWNVANNWWPVGVPTPDITEDISIEANAIIPAGVVAYADSIRPITHDNSSITIEDGGQLIHNSAGLSLTAEKYIIGYTLDSAQTNWNYYLFSSPVDNIAANNVTGLQASSSGHHDLYKFVSNNVEGGELLEWVAVGNGNLKLKEGYIYANRDTTTLAITGTVQPSNDTIMKMLAYNSGYRFGGWNLIGNPFVCNAYVTNNNSANIDYYVLNHQSNYDEFVTASSSDPVAPLSALMVQATAANQSVTYSRTAPSKGAGILNIDVNRTMDRSTTLLDRARVRFGEGEGLQKFQFNPNHTKVYIPEGDKDFAVYYADGAGTIPVNFKAEDNGRYTLDFSTEEIGFNYLHLIDNRNGNDVDLLQTPYYAFDAKSTDFASRFTLVFATGNDNDGNFAFFNNGVWIINNDGKAELQVVDALGRILSSETISGSCSKAINAAPGVYMLRLINGNEVKVQKVVVKR